MLCVHLATMASSALFLKKHNSWLSVTSELNQCFKKQYTDELCLLVQPQLTTMPRYGYLDMVEKIEFFAAVVTSVSQL